MAKKQVVSYSYTCDVCGTTIPDSDSDGSTRKVSWDGTEYVVDVCSTHRSQLGELLNQLKSFVDAGHRGGARRGRRPATAAAAATSPRAPKNRPAVATSAASSSAKRGDLPTIRAWAQSSGLSVGDRGRIPAAVIEAYDAAQGAPAAASSPAPEASAPTTSSSSTPATPAKRRPRKAAVSESASATATPRKRGPRKAAAAAR